MEDTRLHDFTQKREKQRSSFFKVVATATIRREAPIHSTYSIQAYTPRFHAHTPCFMHIEQEMKKGSNRDDGLKKQSASWTEKNTFNRGDFCWLARLSLYQLWLRFIKLFSSFKNIEHGGIKFTTTIRTLIQRDPNSMLAAMFSGRHSVIKDPQKGVSSLKGMEHISTRTWRRSIHAVVPSGRLHVVTA